MSDPLKLESQMVVRCHVGAGDLNPGLSARASALQPLTLECVSQWLGFHFSILRPNPPVYNDLCLVIG